MECTVPLEVCLVTEHADLASLERVIAGALAEAGRQLWQALVARVEAVLPAPAACRECGAPMKAKGRAPRRLVTLAGEVELHRQRYRCTGCGSERVPLDEALGLEPRVQHSLGVRGRALSPVTELSYARTAANLDELGGLPVSRGELHRWVREEGAALEDLQARAQAELFEAGQLPVAEAETETAWISADGTMVHDRGSGTSMEVKVGLTWSGTERLGRERRALRDRRLHGGTEGWHQFAERFVALCARAGVFEAGRRIFVSDGADTIRWLRERYFPDALELLDWYHLVEQLRSGVGQAYPEVLSTALGAPAPGDFAALLAILRSHARSIAASDPDQATRAGALIGYVANNRQGIANYRFVPLASSGSMDKSIDIVVARRFKLRGMSWFRHGVTHLLRLRLMRLNGTWDRYWAGRFQAALRPWPAAA
jgi:hypothetical protein